MTETTTKSRNSEDISQRWGVNAPKGGKIVFNRMIKEGANVPLFVGQTLINSLRDLGYNNTTAALCEHVDNAIEWQAQNVRIYFHEEGKGRRRQCSVLVCDDGVGMAPNVLQAVTAFGGSLVYNQRRGIGRYGMGMKSAALSMAPAADFYSWQEPEAFYCMTLDTEQLSNDRRNMIELPAPAMHDRLPSEIERILTSEMTFPRDGTKVLARDVDNLYETLGKSGTIIYMPDCDRLTYKTVRKLVDHATKEMARIYRRALARGVKIYVNNRLVEPFDPTYRLEAARHMKVEALSGRETTSRLVKSDYVKVPIDEDEGSPEYNVKVSLFVLPFHDWSELPRKVLRNDLHVFDDVNISFVRSDRELQAGSMYAIAGKRRSLDNWWRIEIEFPPELDEVFGLAAVKQGVRPKQIATEKISEFVEDDLKHVRSEIEKFWTARSAAGGGRKRMSEAERMANDAEALQATILPSTPPRTPEEQAELDKRLREVAIAYKNEGETDDDAFERVKASTYITHLKYDEDAPFFRVESQLGKVILILNTAHPFYIHLYRPLAELSAKASSIEDGDDEAVALDADATSQIGGAITTLHLLLLSLARTQASMMRQDDSPHLRRLFDTMRKQWSLNLETQLRVE